MSDEIHVSPAVAAARERLALAKAAAEAARLSEEEAELARLADEEEAANAEARAAKAARRRINLKAREDTARKIAAMNPREKGGPYLVRGVDLADHLPPEYDVDSLPNAGLWVVRSPSRDAVRAMNASIEAKENQDLWAADLVAVSTVDPSPLGESGVRLRGFVDDERHIGAVTMMANAITDLNGTRQKEAKRGRK